MRALTIAVAVMVCFVSVCRATDVSITLTDSRLNVSGLATNRTVQVQRLSVPDMANGQVIIGGKLSFVTDTNGTCVFSNAAAGLYTATVLAPPARTDFQFLVLATNLGPINAGDNLVAASSATFPAGAVAWAAAVTDSRYSRSTNSLTNYPTFAVLTATNNILVALIGQNATNITTSSNTLQTALLSSGSAITNYILSNGQLATNLSLLVGLNGTNFTQTVGTSLTNYINTSANSASNLALLIGLNGTNFSKGIGTAVTNYILAIGLNDTNFAKTLSTNATNFGLSIGLANTNFTLVASNALQAQITSNAVNIVNLSNSLGSAAFMSSATFQPANVNLTNYATLPTNTFVNLLAYQSFTNTFGTAAFVSKVTLQPASTFLTNWAAHATNDYYATNLNLQAGSVALTNFATLGTNFFYPRFNPSNWVDASVTNGLASTNYASTRVKSNIAAGNNIALATNGDVLTITASGSITAAVTNLNGLAGGSQTFSTGTSGTDFAIVSSGTNHQFNLPTASAASRGALSTNDWATFNSKQPGSSALTNWSLHATNDYYATNLNLQSGSSVLSNFVTLGTNAFYNTNANLQAGSTALTNFSTLGTNFFYPRFNPSNFVDATITNNVYAYVNAVGLSLTNRDATVSNQLYAIFAAWNYMTNYNGVISNSLTVRGNIYTATNSFATNGYRAGDSGLSATSTEGYGFINSDGRFYWHGAGTNQLFWYLNGANRLAMDTNGNLIPFSTPLFGSRANPWAQGFFSGGTASAPALVVGSNTNGWYSDAAGVLKASINGSSFLTLASAGSSLSSRLSGFDPLLTNDFTTLSYANASYVSNGIFAAKGDLLTYNGTNYLVKSVGTDGYVLVADSTQTTGLRWTPNTPTAPGTNTLIPFNNGGTLAADPNFRWDTANGVLNIGIDSFVHPLRFFRAASPINTIGAIQFESTNSLGSVIEYAGIQGFVDANTASSEAGHLSLYATSLGSLREVARAATNGFQVLNSFYGYGSSYVSNLFFQNMSGKIETLPDPTNSVQLTTNSHFCVLDNENTNPVIYKLPTNAPIGFVLSFSESAASFNTAIITNSLGQISLGNTIPSVSSISMNYSALQSITLVYMGPDWQVFEYYNSMPDSMTLSGIAGSHYALNQDGDGIYFDASFAGQGLGFSGGSGQITWFLDSIGWLQPNNQITGQGFNIGSTSNIVSTIYASNLVFSSLATNTALFTTNATLNFPSTIAQQSSDLTTPLNGVTTNSSWEITVTPQALIMSTITNGGFRAWVSSANTITVRFSNPNVSQAEDPPSGTYRIVARQFTP